MPCLLAILALISPRVALFFVWIFSDTLSHAFGSWITPLIGFFILPWTTLAYAAFWDWGPGHHVDTIEWFFIAVAFMADLASLFGGNRARSARAY
jgi:hypothetical protein